MTCKHYNPRDFTCAKGTDCDCARACADENIVWFTTCNTDMLILPHEVPEHLDDTWILAESEHDERLNAAKGFINFVVISLIIAAVVLIVWALL